MRLLRFSLAIVLLAATTVLMVAYWPPAVDFLTTFRPATRLWLEGDFQLYDPASYGFYNVPWTLLLLIPFSLPPAQVGQGLLNILSLIVLVTSVHLLKNRESIPIWSIVLGIANVHTADMLFRGQLDAFVLLGVSLGYKAAIERRPLMLSVGLLFMAIKPLNVLLAALGMLFAARRWTRKELALVFSLPLAGGILMGILDGFDWPLRYLRMPLSFPPTSVLATTVWKFGAEFGVPSEPILLAAIAAIAGYVWILWRSGFNRWSLAIALCTSLVFTPYANGNHYVLLVPPFLLIARRNWRIALLAFASTFSPFSRLLFGAASSPLDVLYPFILLVGSWGFVLHERVGQSKQREQTRLEQA